MQLFDAITVSTEQAAELLRGKVLRTLDVGGGSLRWIEDTVTGRTFVLGEIDVTGTYFRLDAAPTIQ